MAKGAIYVNDDTATSGSFERIQITSGDDVNGKKGAQFNDIQFGTGTVANDGRNCHVHNIVADMPVTGSIIIEGPICGFKLTNGEVLAYYN